MKFIVLIQSLLVLFALSVSARPSEVSLKNTLSSKGISLNEIGCKCIMTETTSDNQDTTMCLCYNREDGTLNDSTKCTTLTDNVFKYCTKVTNTTSAWNGCVKSFCPCS
ncbi:hypothetical protein G6F43_007294 [Rhizopus delemar]|nr:hypothetical protein G6F43_007294 [Rhizopus delemar]